MQTKVKHTPTPWLITGRSMETYEIAIGAEYPDKRPDKYYCIAVTIPCGYGKPDRDLHPEMTEANAAFIVKAVNNHEKLVAGAIKNMNAFAWIKAGFNNPENLSDPEFIKHIKEYVDEALEGNEALLIELENANENNN